MTNRTLSPAAQAMLNAFLDTTVEFGGNYYAARSCQIAAALRAAVQELAYEIHCPGEGWYELVIDANDLYAIAAELEGAND
jgi:hypothetical protein